MLNDPRPRGGRKHTHNSTPRSTFAQTKNPCRSGKGKYKVLYLTARRRGRPKWPTVARSLPLTSRCRRGFWEWHVLEEGSVQPTHKKLVRPQMLQFGSRDQSITCSTDAAQQAVAFPRPGETSGTGRDATPAPTYPGLRAVRRTLQCVTTCPHVATKEHAHELNRRLAKESFRTELVVQSHQPTHLDELIQ